MRDEKEDCKVYPVLTTAPIAWRMIVGWGRGGEGGCCITAVGRGAKTGVTCRGVRDWQGGDIGFTEVEHRERGGGSVTRGESYEGLAMPRGAGAHQNQQ